MEATSPRPRAEAVDPGLEDAYHCFSESDLKRLAAAVSWLKASARSFDFWENEEDAVYDGL